MGSDGQFVGPSSWSLTAFFRMVDVSVYPPLPTHLLGVVFTERRDTSNCTFVFTCYCACKWNLTEGIKLVRLSPLLEMLSALGSPTVEMAAGCNRRQIWLCGMPRTCSCGSLKSRICSVATGRIPTDEVVNFKLWVERKWRYPDTLPDPPAFEVWRGEGDSQRVKQKQQKSRRKGKRLEEIRNPFFWVKTFRIVRGFLGFPFPYLWSRGVRSWIRKNWET